jgi:3-deoxy-D-manno-octulosonic-acid transferase
MAWHGARMARTGSTGSTGRRNLWDRCTLRLWGWGSQAWSGMVRLAALLGHARAQSRVAWVQNPKAALPRDMPIRTMWFHCASLGEFEQAVPVMLAYRALRPEVPWLLTLYSPSGYEPLAAGVGDGRIPGWRAAEMDGVPADTLAILPDDLPGTWRRLLPCLSLEGLALAKYDLWPNLLRALHDQGTPIHVFAAAPSSARLWGVAMWRLAQTISAQDPMSASLFVGAGLQATSDGDPRVERVMRREVHLTTEWLAWSRAATQVVVAGSTWPAEERMLAARDWTSVCRLVLVPHDLSPSHLNALDAQWAGRAVRWSRWSTLPEAERQSYHVILVDAVGQLFGLYRLPNACIAVVGGGHGSGLHNVLEPASAGLPIVTGPRLGSFREAHALRGAGSLRAGNVSEELAHWLAHPSEAHRAGKTALRWVQSQTGASAKIVARW